MTFGSISSRRKRIPFSGNSNSPFEGDYWGVPAFVFSKNQFIGVPTFSFQRIPMESFEVPFSRRVRNVLLLKIQIDW
ncbi:hypothetical protein DLM75_21470 [Leptospira stimsonii]|uniref:Uncharacterized protein n=1 Tax=Leptospira stimsonii TaxID=2202203 RepID=A0A396YQN6_9LEPT|nr:hypothetical protein DLM75_21470 [Leptospira stimsonii]